MGGKKGKEYSSWNVLHRANSPPWSCWSISLSSSFPFNPWSHCVHFRCRDTIRCMTMKKPFGWITRVISGLFLDVRNTQWSRTTSTEFWFSTSVKLLLCPAEGKYLGPTPVSYMLWCWGAALACLCLSLCKGVCGSWEKQAQRLSFRRDKHPCFNLKWFSHKTVYS